MKTFVNLMSIRLLCGFFFLLLPLTAQELPTLTFDQGVTWKGVFDAGFRPKHHGSLARSSCICYDQAFLFGRKGVGSTFKIDKGRLIFELLANDKLRMVWHQGKEPITLSEGRRRADEFKVMFQDVLVQDIVMPTVYDPSGAVNAGGDENNVKARIGEYMLIYGFDKSYLSDRPLIPHFYILWNFPDMPTLKLREPGEKIQPPAGYEWYSLDPKIDTPSPGVRNEVKPKHPVLSEEEANRNKAARLKREQEQRAGLQVAPQAESKKKQDKPQELQGWTWALVAILAGIVAAATYWIIKCRRRHADSATNA